MQKTERDRHRHTDIEKEGRIVCLNERGRCNRASSPETEKRIEREGDRVREVGGREVE